MALSLGDLHDPRSLNALAEIIGSRQQEQWFRLAVLSSASNHAAEMFEAMLGGRQDFGSGEFLGQLASLIGIKHDPKEVAQSWDSATPARHPCHLITLRTLNF